MHELTVRRLQEGGMQEVSTAEYKRKMQLDWDSRLLPWERETAAERHHDEAKWLIHRGLVEEGLDRMRRVTTDSVRVGIARSRKRPRWPTDEERKWLGLAARVES